MSSITPLEIKEESLNDQLTYDTFKNLLIKEIAGLLDGKASVQLIEISPRIVPIRYTPEYIAVRAARLSFGYGLKTSEIDTNLLHN